MGQYEEFKAVLDNARNEHDIDTYLKSHRELLRGIGGLYWNCMVIQPEFQIGTKISCGFYHFVCVFRVLEVRFDRASEPNRYNL